MCGTTGIVAVVPALTQFQSTFPCGERPSSVPSGSIISIHVPAWGTTFFPNLLINSFAFQSTFPRGERLHWICFQQSAPYFNPRSRVGNDEVKIGVFNKAVISIHVPAWGTTAKLNNFNSIFLYIQYKFLFNHCFFHYFLLCQFYL